MASNGEIEAEDTEISESNGEKVVTMMDVLQEQEDFEEDANAVLGASDDKNCTYALGYIKRQAIYACMTCCTEAKEDPTKRAGVCLACSLTCHENHELIELYTKRNFRCDCGNPKFNSHPCQFTANKMDLNEENRYNQNFSGVYCVCHRPYPDPEATEEDEMIQCIICEDWLHASHLEATVPSAQYDEMICKGCMDKNEFLNDYSDCALNTENDYVDVVSFNTSTEVNGINENKEDTEELDQSTTSTDVEMPEKNSLESKNNSDVSKILDNNAMNKKEQKIEAEITTDNGTNNQSESNTTMDTDNAELPATNVQVELKADDKIDTVRESSENVILENKDIVEENIDSDVNALKEGLESSAELTKEGIINIEKLAEEKIKDSVEINSEPNFNDTGSNVREDKETEISNGNNTENAHDEKPNNDVSDSVKINAIQNENVDATENSTIMATDTTPNSTSNAENNDLTDDNTIIEKTQDSQTMEASNIENGIKFSNQKSEEELAKIEEDKLLKDPDENRLNEVSESNDKAQVNESTIEISEPNAQSDESVANNSIQIEQDKSNQEQTEALTTISANNTHITENENINSDSKVEVNNEITNSIVKVTPEDTNEKSETKRKLSCETSDSDAKKRKVDVVQCKRSKEKRQCKGATFWTSHFRQKLCTCSECLTMYKDLSVLFLLDPEDTVSAYESLGKEKTNGKPQSQYEKGLQALSSLDRIQQINVLTEYNKMRDKFLEFLKSFKDRRKIVTEDDVKTFFAGMKPTKRPDGVYFCR